LQNNTECRTTDRITGRATSRGYVEGLEQQNRDMQHRIRELEQRLIQSGADIKPLNDYHEASSYDYSQTSAGQTSSWNPAATSYTPPNSNGNAVTTQRQETNMFKALPAFRAEFSDDKYLGVSPGNSNLTSIKGTALSILGMKIDIADFDSLDMDEPDSAVFHPQLYNKSYQAFLQSALNINPRIEKVELPSRDDGFTYADWYFRVLNPYLPLLHKGTFFKLVCHESPKFQISH
jgi:TolA-binding protein